MAAAGAAQPGSTPSTLYDAAMHCQRAGTPTLVFAGHGYGTGSSRDWAAKGTRLLGVKAVVARSFERIHRSNLLRMGVLPLQFTDDDSPASIRLRGDEQFDLPGVEDSVAPRQIVILRVTRADGRVSEHRLRLRIDTPVEADYYRHGGILPYVLRELLGQVQAQPGASI